MAAFVKAINAKIRSNPVTDYVCSTRTYPPRTFFFFLPHGPELRTSDWWRVGMVRNVGLKALHLGEAGDVLVFSEGLDCSCRG